MTFALVSLVAVQTPLSPKAAVAYELTAAKAIATSELASWRKLHPKADLAVSFNDANVTAAQGNVVRQRLGLKNPIPVLDSQVLTIVFDAVAIPEPKRLVMEAYVFQGSFPQGFRARYTVATEGKEPKVLARLILQRYDIAPPKPTGGSAS